MKRLMLSLIGVLLLSIQTLTHAEVTLPRVIGSNMVLQRDMAVPIWGWAAPDEEITITLSAEDEGADPIFSTTVMVSDAEGNWQTELPAMDAGGPYTLRVAGNNTLELTNILFGEVWVCSGQSNMEWSVRASRDADAEIAAADYPKIRLFDIPLVPYALRGAIWYQGESNLQDGMLYHEKMKALINGWREVWGQGDFPFYFVQLAPFNYGWGAGPFLLPAIWEAQAATLSVPHTGMAVTTDVGNLKDIHPQNKQEVGRRLALWALAKTYGRADVTYSGPIYKSMAVEGDTIRLRFDFVGSGLMAKDEQPLTWFEIAGEDKQFVEAKATVDGNTIVVSSSAIANPVAVRFGWHQSAEPNLVNKEGLPASPFRTHPW